MNKNVQRVFLLTTLLVVLVGLGALSAADVSDNTTATQSVAQDTPSTGTQVAATVSDTNDNKIVTDTKTTKTAGKTKSVTKDTQTNKNNVQSTTKTIKTETTENKTDEKENNTIVYGTGNDTSIWAMANGNTVPTSNITVDDVTEVAVMAGTEYDNTYLNSTISPNGSYVLNMQIYLSSNSGYIALPFIVSPVTKQSSGQAQKLFEYTHENGYGWQYSSKNGIAKGETYKIPDHKWVSLNFTIINGSVSVSYNNQTVDLGNVITQDCYFSMRKWGSGSVGVKEIELSKLEEKTFDWYNSTSWTGNPTIDAENNKITMRENRVTYYSQYNIQELQTVTANLYHGTSNGQKTFGLYNPETQKWIGYVTDGTTMKQGINQETGYSTSTNVLDSDVWFIDGSEKAFTIDVSDKTNVKITYTASDGTTTPVVVIPVGTSDLSGYYLAFQDNGRSGMYITNVTTTNNTINTTTENTTTNDTNTTENILDIDWYNTDYWDYDHLAWRNYPTIDVANKKVSMHYNSQTYFKQYNAKELFNVAVDNTIYLIHYNGNPSNGEKVGFYKPDSQGWIYFNAEYPIKKETPVSIRLDGDKLIYTYTSRNGTGNTTGEVSLNGADLSEYYLGFHDYYGEGGMYVKNLSIIQAAPKLNTTLSIDTIADAKFDDKISITGKLTDVNNTNIANADITVTVNNIEYNVTTGEDGTYTVSDVPVVLGVNNVTVTYNGNNSYNKAADVQTTFNGLKHDTLLAVDTITNVKYGGNIAITGKLTDNNTNTGINDVEITVTVNGESHNVKTGTDGTYTVSDVPVVAGVNNVTVTYNGNDMYNKAVDLQTTFTGLSHDTTVTVDTINDTYADTVNVTGKLLDVNSTVIANANITVMVNNVNYPTTTDATGTYTVNVPASIGTNNVTVKYNGDEKYNKAADITTTFNGLAHNTTTTLNPVNGYVGHNITITANVNSNEGTVIFTTSNGTVLGSADVTNSTATITAVFNRTINDIIIANYNGTSKYNPSTANNTININKIDTKLTVTPVNDTTVGNRISITGQLTEEYTGNPITDTQITIIISNKTYNTTTNKEGKYNTTITAPNSAGTYNITVYTGNNLYENSNATTKITILRLNTTATIEPVNGILNKTVTFIAHVKDENGDNVTGGYVIFKVNGVTLKDANNNPVQVNVVNGTAVLTTVATWSTAKNTTVVYSGNDAYSDSRMDEGSISLAKQNATVNVSINDNLKPGDNLIIIVNITDDDNNTVNAGKVVFKLNGKTLENVNVTNGQAVLNYTIPENYSPKTYNITVIFAGSIYNRADVTDNFTLSALDANLTLNVTSENMKPGSQLIAVTNITDVNGNQVNRGKVLFKLNGKTLKDENNQTIEYNVTNGQAILNYTIPNTFSAKTYNLTAVFGGSNYNTVRVTQNITLLKTDTRIDAANVTINRNLVTVKANIINNETNTTASERPIKVSVKLDQRTIIKQTIVNNGIINLNTTLNYTPTGNHTVEIVSGENGLYNTGRLNVTI